MKNLYVNKGLIFLTYKWKKIHNLLEKQQTEKAIHQREIMRASQHNKQSTKTPISYEGHTNEKQDVIFGRYTDMSD